MEKINFIRKIFTIAFVCIGFLTTSIYCQTLEEKQKKLERMKEEMEFLIKIPDEYEKIQKMYQNLEIEIKDQVEQKKMQETLSPSEYDKWKQSKIEKNKVNNSKNSK